tara:strand:- start:3380 stop:3679 length:300 start_codon:yes stop_codon:yes gene_type:complete
VEQFVEEKEGKIIVHGLLLVDKLNQMIQEAEAVGNTHPVLVLSENQYVGMKAKIKDGLDKVERVDPPKRKDNSPLTGASFNKMAIIVTYNEDLVTPLIL